MDVAQEVPFVAIGNEELVDPIGESVQCPRCSETHPVEYGDEICPDGTRKPSKVMGFYRCGEKMYLCAVNGRSVMGRLR